MSFPIYLISSLLSTLISLSTHTLLSLFVSIFHPLSSLLSHSIPLYLLSIPPRSLSPFSPHLSSFLSFSTYLPLSTPSPPSSYILFPFLLSLLPSLTLYLFGAGAPRKMDIKNTYLINFCSKI